MRYDALVLLLGLFFAPTPAAAQVSIGIGLPSVSMGINLPSFPELVVVPDYPVYYAPRGNVNLFFYDGMYWAYERDNWYAGSWYNGPWWLVGPEVVPVFVLRIPVRYYRHPPVAWAGWRPDGPPRWGERWGHDWEQRRRGWDRWDRRARHAPAPLPVYQRQYSGDRYPRVEQQQVLQREKYRYEPKEPVVREHVQQQRAQSQPAERRQQDKDSRRSSAAPPPVAPAVQDQKQQPQPAPVRNEQEAPKSQDKQDRRQAKGQGKAEKQEPPQQPEPGQERGHARHK